MGKLVSIRNDWREQWHYLAEVLQFQYLQISSLCDEDILKNSYLVIPLRNITKSRIDEMIMQGNNRYDKYVIASILYSLYACERIVVNDIAYPRYSIWKQKHSGMTLDHKLPKSWFPELTFDCDNWQPLSWEANKAKGDDFITEGMERLELLENRLREITSKYLQDG